VLYGRVDKAALPWPQCAFLEPQHAAVQIVTQRFAIPE
jgi:hypothetical protein